MKTTKIIVSVIILLVVFAAIATAAKITIDTGDGPVTIEGEENVILKFLKSFFGGGDKITGKVVAEPTTVNMPKVANPGIGNAQIVIPGEQQ